MRHGKSSKQARKKPGLKSRPPITMRPQDSNKAGTLNVSGWRYTAFCSTEDVKSQATGAGFLGGMISAKRKYKKDKSSVTVEIITDSPALQSMVMMFSNPAYAPADGGQITKIKGQKAIIKYHPSQKSGEINIVVAKQYLISVEGQNINQNDLVDYASEIDYKKLKKF
jgi:hypothetical protein